MGRLGIWPGGVSRPRPKGEVGGLAGGGVSRPRPSGGSAQRGVQAHTKDPGPQWGVQA